MAMAAVVGQCTAYKPQHTCTHCGAQHASRSALFRHLRAQCDPTLNKENAVKLAVVVAYAGDANLGDDDARAGGPVATTQLLVKAVADACVRASGATVASTHVAVSTEKHAGARANVVVVALRGLRPGSLPIGLHEHLPQGLHVLSARFLTNSAADQALAGRLTKRVRRCAHVIAVPYAAIVKDDDESDDGQTVFVVATLPGGRDPSVDEAWIRAAARAAAAPSPDTVESGGEAFARLSYGDARSASKAVARLDGHVSGDVALQAMAWREACAKLDAHKRLKDALAGASRAVFSGASILRPASLARDDRKATGDWRDDWILVRVRGGGGPANQGGPPRGGTRTARLCMGAAVAVCRGAEGADWLATLDSEGLSAPAAPARALYLEGLALYLAKADARCADVDEAAPEDARLRARALVVAGATNAASRAAWRRLVCDIDAGATRKADDETLRAAAFLGDAEAVATILKAGRARVDATDEYGRTALFLAAVAGRPVVDLLLEAGADPMRAAHGGWTPQHFLADEGARPAPPAWRRRIARDPPPPTVRCPSQSPNAIDATLLTHTGDDQTAERPGPPPRRQQRRRRRRRDRRRGRLIFATGAHAAGRACGEGGLC